MGTRWSKKVDKNETVQWNGPHTGQDENWEVDYVYILPCKREEERCCIWRRERLEKLEREDVCFLLSTMKGGEIKQKSELASEIWSSWLSEICVPSFY